MASRHNKLGLRHLSWPIGIELLLQFLMGTVDTLMVSRIGDNAVSAVGVSNQVLQTAMTLFTVINAGAGAILARMWGARNWEATRRTAAIAIQINVAFGLAGGLFFLFASGQVLRMMQVPGDVFEYAHSYLSIVGGGMMIVTLHLVVNALIRNTGNTKGPMVITIGMNVLHLLLNYVLIFGVGLFPAMGVEGSAISTVVSRAAALALSIVLLWRSFEPRMTRQDWFSWDRSLLKDIVGIGLPVSVTAMSWGFSQIVLLSVIASLGANALASYTYIQTIQQFPWMIAAAVGSALSIQIGQWYGASQHQLVYRGPLRAISAGLILIATAAVLIWIGGEPIMSMFTSNADIIALSLPLLGLCIIWQTLRVIPFCLSNALNIVGSARPVAILSVIGMWLVSTGGAYWFGAVLGWGLPGVLLAMMLDEVLRGSFFVYQWFRRQRRLVGSLEQALSAK
ncbi:putative MATE family efflux protein [Paenibacillus phyllosphaerae]|uniref:Putative MATE family efflux protein n=1 Tax=Paenibacillus phyllosphaerae TaxID=274593 RepID=A0A7W5AVG8_9BACL|nr:MATE family efflux transporter [Paenibacillus phyllosphaerae]MBB3109545.1 putative MATE family efflux protein [Paenibacillus phyllosphaerae]